MSLEDPQPSGRARFSFSELTPLRLSLIGASVLLTVLAHVWVTGILISFEGKDFSVPTLFADLTTPLFLFAGLVEFYYLLLLGMLLSKHSWKGGVWLMVVVLAGNIFLEVLANNLRDPEPGDPNYQGPFVLWVAAVALAVAASTTRKWRCQEEPKPRLSARARVVVSVIGGFALLTMAIWWVRRLPDITATEVKSKPLRIDADSAIGNASLQCVVLSSDGAAAYINAGRDLSITDFKPSEATGTFTDAAVDTDGNAFLVGAHSVIYKAQTGSRLTPLTTTARFGDLAGFAVDARTHLIWWAAIRQDTPKSSLVVYCLDSRSGRLLAKANLGAKSSGARLTVNPLTGVVAVLDGVSPRCCFVELRGPSLVTTSFTAKAGLSDAVCRGSDFYLSDEFGSVLAVDPATGLLKREYQGDSYRDYSVEAGPNRLIVGRGHGDVFVGEGELDIYDLESGKLVGNCSDGTRMVTDVSRERSDRSILFADEAGPIRRYSPVDGCRNISTGDPADNGHVLFLGTEGKRCLLVRSDRVEVFTVP